MKDAVVAYDHDNRRPRGFGFVAFGTDEAVAALQSAGSMQTLHDKQIEVKPAWPPERRRSSRPARRRVAGPGLCELSGVSGYLDSFGMRL